MEEKIYKIVSDAFNSVSSVFPYKKHDALSKKYPEGVKQYYIQERMKLLFEIKDKSCIGRLWINDNMTSFERQDVVAVYLNLYSFGLWRTIEQHIGSNDAEDAFLEFIQNDFVYFLEAYNNYKIFENLIESVTETTYKGLANDLREFVNTTDEILTNVITYKQLPEKILWRGNPADAVRFCEITGLKVSEWNRCFYLKNNKQLKYSHKSIADYKDLEIVKTLKKYVF